MTAPDMGPRIPELEGWLNERAIPWRYEQRLDLTRLDVAASLRNQARLEPLVDEVVARYAADMGRGDVFPPVVVHEEAAGARLVIVGGNHRAAAAVRAELRHLPAYVVRCTPGEQVRLALEDNRRHGLPLTRADRVAHALQLVRAGETQAEAARACGLTGTDVSRAAATVRVEERARRLGVDVDGLARGQLHRFDALERDAVFAEALRAAAAAEMPGQSVAGFVNRVLAGRDEADQLAIVAEEEARADARGRPGRISDGERARRILSAALIEIRGLDPDAIAGACRDRAGAELAQRILDAAQVMSRVHQLLERRRAA